MRDFTQVFDAYSQFEESMINAKMEATAETGPSEDGWPHLHRTHHFANVCFRILVLLSVEVVMLVSLAGWLSYAEGEKGGISLLT